MALKRPSIRSRLRAAWRALRGYDGAKTGNSTWSNVVAALTTANTELAMGGNNLRTRSLELYRNNSTARSIVEGLVALIVSTGIDVEPDTGNPEIDDRLRDQWRDWCEHAAADGRLSLWELQRQGVRSMILTGDLLWQMVALPDELRPIPTCIHPIDAIQLSDEAVAAVANEHRFACGVERDSYNRPISYHIKELTDAQSYSYAMGSLVPKSLLSQPEFGGGSISRAYCLPAKDVLHSFESLRAGQARGEPWMAPVLTSIQNEKELVSAELLAAKIGAAFAAVITSMGGADGLKEGTGDDSRDGNGNTFTKLEGGIVASLNPGEDIKQVGSSRPSQMIAPFRQMLRGDIAGATRLRQQDLDKDYSRASYTSMRAAQLDLRRMLDPVQQWVGKAVAGDLYQRVLPELAIASGVAIPSNPRAARRFRRYTLHPDGHPYVNPTEDVQAALMAIAGGLSSWKDEQAQRGKDARQVQAQLEKELKDPLLAAVFAANIGKPAPPQAKPTDSATGTKPAADVKDTEVIETSLNGAQVTSMQEVIQSVADGRLPASSAELLLIEAFPAMNPQAIKDMVAAADAFEPTPTEPAKATP